MVYNPTTETDAYLFTPDGTVEIVVPQPLTKDQAKSLSDANQAASMDFVTNQLSRLALHKSVRVCASSAKAFMSDIASDIAGVGEIALVEACSRLRRSEGAFYPTSFEIVKMVKQVTDEINKAIASAGQLNGGNGA